MKQAYFAGGCFWCITPSFQELYGVEEVVSGYCGGAEENPTYEEVRAQKTGHRETIRVVYDEEKVTFAQLFDLFLSGVDPFDGEGQYIDRGRSYTLAVYYTEEKEKEIALQKIEELTRQSGRQVFLSVEPFTAFYDAEEYHQNYYLKHPEAFERELRESGRKREEVGQA